MSADRRSGTLYGKAALVTGGARGLGAGIAAALADAGARVAVCDILDAEGSELCASLRASGHDARFYKLDVTSAQAWEALADELRSAGGLNVLVNNAGIIARRSITTITADEWRKVIDINLTGTFYGIKFCAPLMQEWGAGSIINISSTAGLTGHSDPAYTASKWAVRGLTKSAAGELARSNIRVNSIHPATVLTPLQDSSPPNYVEISRRAIPLGREGKIEDVANAVVFLASDQAAFITGAELALDGGYSAAGLLHLRSSLLEGDAAQLARHGQPGTTG